MIGAAVLAGVLVLTAAGDQPSAPPTVEVQGNQLIDSTGEVVQLRGVNRSGTEWACVQGEGIFDGPVDHTAIAAMSAWGINSVRIPLNEDCWLGAEGLSPELSGESYRAAIVDYADRLNAAGMMVILDLHWTGTDGDLARGQQPMARAGSAPRFWRSVAADFRDRPGVIFDAFNEPHDISWECWRDGCDGHAGMQELVDSIRAAGAEQPIILSGLDWGADLSGWGEFVPDDPAEALVAGAHFYDFKTCNGPPCIEMELAKISEAVPIVISEFGDTDCNGDFSRRLMAWADSAHVSYVAWAWNTWDCSGGPGLVESFEGSPTGFGEAVRDWFTTRGEDDDLPRRIHRTESFQ